jgi:hypothetical protein
VKAEQIAAIISEMQNDLMLDGGMRDEYILEIAKKIREKFIRGLWIMLVSNQDSPNVYPTLEWTSEEDLDEDDAYEAAYDPDDDGEYDGGDEAEVIPVFDIVYPEPCLTSA